MYEFFSNISEEELKMQISENSKDIDKLLKELTDFNVKYTFTEKATAL